MLNENFLNLLNDSDIVSYPNVLKLVKNIFERHNTVNITSEDVSNTAGSLWSLSDFTPIASMFFNVVYDWLPFFRKEFTFFFFTMLAELSYQRLWEYTFPTIC